MAKVMGSLAGSKPEDGHKVSGVLIKRGFNYHLIDPSDLSSMLVRSLSYSISLKLSLFNYCAVVIGPS